MQSARSFIPLLIAASVVLAATSAPASKGDAATLQAATTAPIGRGTFPCKPPWAHTQTLTAADRDRPLRFGQAVALAGDTLAISAPAGDTRQPVGAVHIYQRGEQGWREVQVIRPEPSVDEFGALLALDDDWLAVTAEMIDLEPFLGDRGAVYLYERSAGRWEFRQRLQPGGLAHNALFGWGLALDGDTLLVGAVHQGPPDVYFSERPGAVYEYRRQAGLWVEAGEVSPAVTEWRRFGGIIALSGDWAVISAFPNPRALPPERVLEAFSRPHLVFRRTGGQWREVQKLYVADEMRAVPKMGRAVLNGERLLAWGYTGWPAQAPEYGRIPPPFAKPGEVDTDWAAAMTFKLDNGLWKREQVLDRLDWPTSVGVIPALEGEVAVVARHEEEYRRIRDVLVFELVGERWMRRARLQPRLMPVEWSVWDIDSDENTIVVGNNWAGSPTLRSGAGEVYVFERVPPASDCVCREVLERVALEEIDKALVDPAAYSGWQQPRNRGLAPGPHNPPRMCLALRDPGIAYNAGWNTLVWRVGCR